MWRLLPVLGITLVFAPPAAADPVTLGAFGMMTVSGSVEVLDHPGAQQVLKVQLGLSPKAGDAFAFSFGIRNFHIDVGSNVLATISGPLTLTVGSQSFSSDYNGAAVINHYSDQGLMTMSFYFRPNPEFPAVTTQGEQPFTAVQSDFTMGFVDSELGVGTGGHFTLFSSIAE
jgi:hypothetical protein